MIEIDKHIEILLLSNECVIIPGFGGFTTHYVAARHDDRDNMFLPPIRTIGFNPQLRINDSLLVQSYVECYDISYPEALKHIEAEVDQLKTILNNEGECEFSDIGKITLNNDGNYEFTPCESGLLTPDLYGLSSYEFKPLTMVAANKEVKTEQAKTATSSNRVLLGNTPIPPAETIEEEEAVDEEHETIGRGTQIVYHLIRNVAAACIAIIVMVLIASPLDNNKQSYLKNSGIDTDLLYRVLPKSVNTAPANLNISTPKAANHLKIQPKQTEALQTDTASSYYTLVLASRVSKTNAKLFTERLHKEGYEDAQVIITRNNVKVVYGHFDTEGEAYRMVNKMHGLKHFEDCWVTFIK
ncbi:HU domain-containing protein [Prevotella sp.]|uniref:HU domain-containing protein n=1 Tax=Prevotella sp. TaxID=59823 RepID=UPI002F949693